MKKLLIYMAAYLILVAVVLALILYPPQFSSPENHGQVVLRGTIVHNAEVDEGHLIYLSCPERSDTLYLLLVTDEADVQEKLMNWIKAGFSGDEVEVLANSYTESDPIAGQYVQLVESMKLYENN